MDRIVALLLASGLLAAALVFVHGGLPLPGVTHVDGVLPPGMASTFGMQALACILTGMAWQGPGA